MAKRTREEIEAELAALDEESDEDDDEVEYGNPDGSYWRGKVRHAKRLGLYKVPEPPKEEGKGEGGSVRSARFGGGGAGGTRRSG